LFSREIWLNSRARESVMFWPRTVFDSVALLWRASSLSFACCRELSMSLSASMAWFWIAKMRGNTSGVYCSGHSFGWMSPFCSAQFRVWS
jgi:hypothetical protein